MASAAFASNLVCLRTLGEQIINQRLLYDLCLASKLFSVEFSRFLYRHVVTTDEAGFSALVESRHLGHVRTLSFQRGPYRWLCGDDVHEKTQQLLARTPHLESFKWKGPLPQATIDQLHQCCKNVRQLHIEYPDDLEEEELGITGEAASGELEEEDMEEARRLYLVQDISLLAKLSELTISHIYGDLPRWVRQLSQVLGQSPNLQRLSLSLSTDVIRRIEMEAAAPPDDYWDFFDSLCDQYGQATAPPLKLRSLHCGLSIYPTRRSSLEKLVDLAALEEIRIDNSGFFEHQDYLILYNDNGRSLIAFDAFLSSVCSRLRRFSATDLQPDVFDALCNAGAAHLTRQLAVLLGRVAVDEENSTVRFLRPDPAHPSLPLRLRMMDIQLSGLSDEEQRQVLRDLVATNADSLEGIAVHMPHLGGSSMHNSHPVDLLVEALPKLRLVTQLGIVLQSEDGGNALSDEGAARVAKRVAGAAPQLRFVSVSGIYWSVWRAGDGEPGVVLERLDEERERIEVELFAHRLLVTHVVSPRW